MDRMYLVLAACTMDDVPLLLTADRAEAEHYAAEVLEETVARVAADVFGMEHSGLVCVKVVEFEAGRPVGADLAALCD